MIVDISGGLLFLEPETLEEAEQLEAESAGTLVVNIYDS